MSSNSQVRGRRVREVTPGTTPGTAMNVYGFRNLDFEQKITREKPGNVESNRQPRDNPAMNLEVSGSASADYLIGAYDDIREDAFAAAYVAVYTSTGTDVACVASGNKLTKAAGWGTLASYSLIKVLGFSTNGAVFYGLVGLIASTDCPLTFPTLVNESAGPSVTVEHDGNLTLGTTLFTATYETINTNTSFGETWPYVACSSWSFDMTHPGQISQAWNFVGGKKNTTISAALGNSSNAQSTNPVLTAGVNFGDGLNPTRGLGIRLADALKPNYRVKKLSFNLSNPILADGGAGTFGPMDATLDGMFEATGTLQLLRNHADGETLIANANLESFVASLAWGWVDGLGNSEIFYLPGVQFSGDKASGVSQSGRQTLDFNWMAKTSTNHGMVRVARFLV